MNLLVEQRNWLGNGPRCLRPEIRRTAASACQVLVLLSLAIIVSSVLWLRDWVAGREADTVDRTREYALDDISSATVSRAEYAARCPLWSDSLGQPARVANRGLVRASLPVGRTYEVVVRGGVTGRLRDRRYGAARRIFVAYVFEVRYRRDIESNDGQRIVERRTFLAVREAKLLTPVGEMTLNLGPPETPELDRIVFPGPGEGINAGPVRKLAETILASGVQAVADCPESRAFLEQDILSGKSVRLTFVDGEGIASVEPLGWTLPGPQARYLFSQRVMPTELLPGPEATTNAGSLRPLSLLTDFLNPSQAVAGDGSLVVTAQSGPSSSLRSYAISLAAAPSAPSPDKLPSPCERAARVHLGTFAYDQAASIVTQAQIRWPLGETEHSAFTLLFERPLQGQFDVTVHYSCRVL